MYILSTFALHAQLEDKYLHSPSGGMMMQLKRKERERESGGFGASLSLCAGICDRLSHRRVEKSISSKEMGVCCIYQSICMQVQEGCASKLAFSLEAAARKRSEVKPVSFQFRSISRGFSRLSLYYTHHPQRYICLIRDTFSDKASHCLPLRRSIYLLSLFVYLLLICGITHPPQHSVLMSLYVCVLVLVSLQYPSIGYSRSCVFHDLNNIPPHDSLHRYIVYIRV